jgi:signal transduction histidine kinase
MRTQRLELASLLAVLVGLAAIAFGGFLSPPGGAWSLSFLCLLPTIWAAFRFGRRESAAAVLITAGLAVWGTLRNTAAFLGRENEALVLLQLFMGVVSVTSLSLAAVVSERRRAFEGLARQAAELARSNAELDEFARVVSHDLKAPLRGISSMAAWIAEDCKDVLPAASQKHLSLLDERARRMSRLIDGVQSYSRIGRARSDQEIVDSRLVAEEVVDSLARPPGVTVRIEGSLPRIHYDRTQLAQVFQNLIQNGVEHLGRPVGEVVVSCREGAEEFEFSVRDDGIGIPRSHVDRIFQMFQVVHPEGETTGVGLAIVRKIVEMRGGSVSVTSTPGRGASFRFSVPKRPP